RVSDSSSVAHSTFTSDDARALDAVRVGGRGAVLAGIVFLGTSAYTFHFLCLLPAPRGLAVIAGGERATIRMATVAGVAGAVVGMIAAQVNAATAPPLAAASVALPQALLPGVWLQSELAGGLGLQLRLLSDLLIAVWLGTT